MLMLSMMGRRELELWGRKVCELRVFITHYLVHEFLWNELLGGIVCSVTYTYSQLDWFVSRLYWML